MCDTAFNFRELITLRVMTTTIILNRILMPLVNLSVKHNTTFDDAKQRLDGAVADVQTKFSSVVKNITWSPDRTAVKLTGPGVIVDLSVDAEHVHATGDVPLLNLLGGGFAKRISDGLKGALQRHFPKGIPDKT